MQDNWLSYLNVEYLDNKLKEIEGDKEKVISKISNFFDANIAIPPDFCFYISDYEKKALSENSKDKDVFYYRNYGYKSANLDPKLDCESLNKFSKSFKKRLENTEVNSKAEFIKNFYCETISMQAGHIDSSEERSWLFSNFENLNSLPSKETRIKTLKKLIDIELFEKFLHFRFTGSKRFSIEGLETVFVIFDSIISRLFDYKIKECVFGMPHRGRISFLTNVLDHPYEKIISEFLLDEFDEYKPNVFGDVKYHIGGTRIISPPRKEDEHSICLNLLPNPSHLESVFPVVLGKCYYKHEKFNNTVLPIICHGDSALCGQGVVYESFGLSKIDGYDCGGAIHIVINNGIGFTTMPREYSSMLFPTDIAKAFDIPVFHLNAYDPDAAYSVAELAIKYRQKFKKDVIINCVGYRKYGHNEGDEPTYTQPVLYKKIFQLPSIADIYKKQLIKEDLLSESQIKDTESKVKNALENAENAACKEKSYFYMSYQYSRKRDFFTLKQKTGISKESLKFLEKILTSFPKDFKINPKLEKFLLNRRSMILGEQMIDWGAAEFIALASIVNDGISVRFSGQDAIRGTFSHRHACFFDFDNGEKFCPIKLLESKNVRFNIFNSPLSEYAALGFEYGYSTECINNSLCIWEAQFGDFANGAQIIIDQFIVSGFSKWGQESNLVLLLPHGYEGQGPDHSSGRIERYLQMCANYNMFVVNCSLPSNFFHALRRQVYAKVPMIVFTPKSMLRNKFCKSSLEDFLDDRNFKSVIDEREENFNKELTKKIILCTGKIYYELIEIRKIANASEVAIITIEQLYPFPENEVFSLLSTYPSLNQILWCQEEPKNMGAWNYVFVKFYESKLLLNDFFSKLKYVGRDSSPTSATGYYPVHTIESREIFNSVFFDR